jgi:hypothetical protein
MKASRESALVRACLQLLALRGVPCWRANTGAVCYGEGPQRRFVRFGTPGVSDILGLLPPAGRMLVIEVKARDGRVRPSQRAFMDAVTAAGGVALVVRDVGELAQALDGLLGVPT